MADKISLIKKIIGLVLAAMIYLSGFIWITVETSHRCIMNMTITTDCGIMIGLIFCFVVTLKVVVIFLILNIKDYCEVRHVY